jgi:hypothetical protein
MSNKEPDVIHFKTDPGVEGSTFINMQISEMLNCQVRGRAAIIHN